MLHENIHVAKISQARLFLVIEVKGYIAGQAFTLVHSAEFEPGEKPSKEQRLEKAFTDVNSKVEALTRQTNDILNEEAAAARMEEARENFNNLSEWNQ